MMKPALIISQNDAVCIARSGCYSVTRGELQRAVIVGVASPVVMESAPRVVAILWQRKAKQI